MKIQNRVSDSAGGASVDKSSPKSRHESTPAQTSDPAADALAQYRVIVGQAASYDYGANDPDAAYRYALVRMRADYDVPALLLKQKGLSSGINIALVFQYDPDSEQVTRADGTLMEGIASAGGFRGSLFAAGDGNGILFTKLYSGTGMGSVSRITLNGNTLQNDMILEGNIMTDTNQAVKAIGKLKIDWHNIADLSDLTV